MIFLAIDPTNWLHCEPILMTSPTTVKEEKMYISQLEREGEGIANAATWVKQNTICFDSIEVLTHENTYLDIVSNGYRELTMKYLLEGAEKGLDRVTMGESNHNNQGFNYSKLSIDVKTHSEHPFVYISRNEISYLTTNH